MIFDRMENAKQYESLGRAWWAAFDAMARYDAAAFAPGKTALPAGLFLSQMEETLKPVPEAFEAHRKYADLMFMAEGEETVFYTPAAALQRLGLKRTYAQLSALDAAVREACPGY